MGQDRFRSLLQPGPQYRVSEVVPRLIKGGKRIALRHCAVTETGDLRKNIPHPVSFLPSRLQFGQRLIENRRLSLDKMRERIVACHSHAKARSR